MPTSEDVYAYTPDQIAAMFAAYQAAPDSATVAELRVLMDAAAAKAIAPPEPPQDTSRTALIELCRDGVVPEGLWCNRDSAQAQRQLGEARALLRAGCDYVVLDGDNLKTNDLTVWIEVTYRGFSWFEGGYDDRDDALSTATFYLPTRKRLNANEGQDWY